MEVGGGRAKLEVEMGGGGEKWKVKVEGGGGRLRWDYNLKLFSERNCFNL